MLSQPEIQAYCRQHNLPALGTTYVDTMVNSDPARVIGNRMGNVCGRYASEKMGYTLQFESHTLELPFLVRAEHNDSVLAIYDQPPQIRLECPKKDGKLGAFLYTPDFGLLEKEGPRFVECKPVAKLRELSLKTPWKYTFGPEGKWHCPPADKAAAELGFRFHVVTEEDLNPVFTINAQLLSDDVRADREPVNQSTQRLIREAVSTAPGITVAALISLPHSFRVEDVYWTLANHVLFFDWEAAPLTQPERVRVYATSQVADAYRCVAGNILRREIVRPSLLELRPGAELVWNDRMFRILNVGVDTVVLASGTDSVSVAREVFERHVKAGEISGLESKSESPIHPEVVRILGETREADLSEALRRHRAIKCETPRDQIPESERTICRWKEQYRIAEAKYGNGFIGLLPGFRYCGNRGARFPQRILELMETIYAEHYLTKKAKSAKRAYEQLQLQCERQGFRAPL